jgi:hypothetical protein
MLPAINHYRTFEYLREWAGGKLIHEKNLKLKISYKTPFKQIGTLRHGHDEYAIWNVGDDIELAGRENKRTKPRKKQENWNVM